MRKREVEKVLKRAISSQCTCGTSCEGFHSSEGS